MSLLAVVLWVSVMPQQVVEPLALSPVRSLSIAAGTEFKFPVTAKSPSMVKAIWRGEGMQMNLHALPESERKMATTNSGAYLACADFSPVKLADGSLLESSVKYVVRATDGTSPVLPSAMVVAKTTLRAEVRLMMDPTGFDIGSDLFVRLYSDGIPQEKAKFKVLSPGGVSSEYESDSEALGHFNVAGPGVWKVSFETQLPNAKTPTLRTAAVWFEMPNKENQ